MNIILRVVFGLFVFFSIFLGMHFYVYFRLNYFFKLSFIKWVILSLALVSPFVMVLSRFSYNFVSRSLYTLTSVWFGVLFFLLSSFLVYEVIRFFIKLSPLTWGFTILSVVLVITITSLIFGQFVFVKEITVPVEGLDNNLKIVHLSDIHVGTIHNSGFLSNIVKKTNDLNPDMVLITGDLFDAVGPVREHGVEALKMLKAKTFFSTGNHEHYENIDLVTKTLMFANITFLRDEVANFKGVQIVGMDHPANDQFIGPDLSKIKINNSKPSILLFHQPKGMVESEKAGIDLQLSGHTHAGQIFPFNFLVKIFYPNIKGLYKIGGMYLHVSPGTGTWGPPMRFGSRNEIVLINLVSQKP